MSAGHARERGEGPSEIKRTAALAAVKDRLEQATKLDRACDLPYLAGYSKDGRTVYIDRHLPKKLRIGLKTVSVDSFLRLHEETEKALLDELGWTYWPAHHVATYVEERAVRAAGIGPHPYERALKPYIKADEREKLVRIPLDLDLTPYLAQPVDKALLRHLRDKMGLPAEKEPKSEAGYSQGKPSAHCGLCLHFEQPRSCDIVRGAIDPAMWCRYFERK